jgi:hypothetical protein
VRRVSPLQSLVATCILIQARSYRSSGRQVRIILSPHSRKPCTRHCRRNHRRILAESREERVATAHYSTILPSPALRRCRGIYLRRVYLSASSSRSRFVVGFCSQIFRARVSPLISSQQHNCDPCEGHQHRTGDRRPAVHIPLPRKGKGVDWFAGRRSGILSLPLHPREKDSPLDDDDAFFETALGAILLAGKLARTYWRGSGKSLTILISQVTSFSTASPRRFKSNTFLAGSPHPQPIRPVPTFPSSPESSSSAPSFASSPLEDS